MQRPKRRRTRPELECCEGRALMSAITSVLAGNSAHLMSHVGHPLVRSLGGLGTNAYTSAQNYGAAITLGSTTLTQGPVLNANGSINNMALAPTGNPKPGELRRQRFTASFRGPYRVILGRTTTQAAQVLIQGGGSANTMHHSDIQIRIVQPKDRNLPFGGVGTIFDRNINSNSALGFNISAPQGVRGIVDRHGLPIHFPSVSVDVNESAGTYVESYGQGTMNIRYLPSGKGNGRTISQGTAIVTMHMQIYAPGASYLLRNASLNP